MIRPMQEKQWLHCLVVSNIQLPETHLPQLFIFLEKQQAALKPLEISLNINVIKGRKHLGNTGIVLTESVLPAHLALPGWPRR